MKTRKPFPFSKLIARLGTVVVLLCFVAPLPVYTATTLSFAIAVKYTVGNGPSMVIVADFNGDGKLDLTTANSGSNSVSLLLGNGDGTFQSASSFPLGISPISLVSGDFNGDGKPDLATANATASNVSILLGNGSGGFGTPTNFPTGSLPYSIAAGDFNGDSKLDLATANSGDNSVSLLIGDGTGNFGAPVAYPVGSNPQMVKVADFNGDSKPDLATVNYNSNNLSILLNNGSGGFTTAVNYNVGSSPTQLTIADFNGDGTPDVATANFGSATASLLLNNGSGGFGTPTTYAGSLTALAVGDFNQDSKPDLVTTNLYSTNLTILPNNGAGGFGNVTSFPVGANPYAVAVGDFNGDNKPDIVTANNSANNLSVILNTTLAPSATISSNAGTPQSTPVNTTFSVQFKVLVKDLANNPLSGVSVIFSAPVSGPGGTFVGFGTTVIVATDANGIATAPTFTANCQVGSYRVSADVSGAATPAYFYLTNTAGSPASILTSAGANQSAVHNTDFAAAMKALVRDSCGNPVSGVSVNFAAPTSGASGTFSGGGTSATVTTDASGIASAPAFTANGTLGSYTVKATVVGFPVAGTANFNQTNKAGSPTSLTINTGTPQSTPVGTSFSTALVVSVQDSGGYPVSGVTVNFAAPTTGPSGTFSGWGSSANVTTDSNGLATAPAFTANCQAGNYTVKATVSGIVTSANFSLSNTPGSPSNIIVKSGSDQRTLINTAFVDPLKAFVKDSCGNPLSNLTVNFVAPASGTSGTFSGGSTSTTATTDASGIVTAPTFTANSTSGTYNVTATIVGFPVAGTATFKLTNLPTNIGSITPAAYQANPAHTGALSLPNFAPALKQKWSVDLNGTIDQAIVAENKVFVTARSGGYNPLRLYAIDIATGTIAWGPVTNIGNSFYAVGLAYENGKVFVMNDAIFWAFDAASGNLLWYIRQPLSQLWSFGPPTALNGIIYNSGTGSGGVNAVRQSDGVQIWSVGSADGGNTTPAVTDDGVYVANGCIYKYNPLTGAVMWSYVTNCPSGSTTPVVYNNRVYITAASGSGLVLDANTGALLSGTVRGATPAFSNGVGYYVYNGSLQARNATTDVPLWSANVAGQTLSTPTLVINGYAYVGSNSATGDIYGFDVSNGSQVWHGSTGSSISGALAAGDGVLVAPAGTKLAAFDPTGPIAGYSSNPAPGSVTVGSSPLGIAISKPITISETGTADLTVSNPLLAGSNSADFAIRGVTFPFTITDGGPSQSLTVNCTPSRSGLRTATLSLNTNDPTKATVTYNLSCTGTTVVINPGDDGSGTTPGTLSYYFVNDRVSSGQTISFALTTGTTITITGQLPPVPVGITVDGGSCNGGIPAITLDGTQALTAINGLKLSGATALKNLKITGFKGPQLITNSSGNHLKCVVAHK